MKEPSVDASPGFVHVAFGSNRDDTNKEDYYSYGSVGPPPPTNTPTATNTPLATPTPCTPGSFSDVHPSDYFYTPVHDLAIAGVISGYGDCTYRPYNNITRGQAAKIVVLGSGRPINTTGGPHFNDVPTSHPFYAYIETAYNAGVISGYGDGSFKPQNNVTRGQFSKMNVLAFSFPINTTGGPHFTDVPTNNAFYQFIETAYNLGLISGYSDHTFRPNTDITRGQAAKIVYQARQQAPNTPTPTNSATSTSVATSTPIVVTATYTVTPIVVTATYTNTPFVVTATATNTPVGGSPTATSTATSAALALPR